MRFIDPEVWKLDLLLFHGCNEKTAWLIDRINHAPTIDAVPVIRCKDCKHMHEDGVESYCDDSGRYIDGTGFCKWAERKEE